MVVLASFALAGGLLLRRLDASAQAESRQRAALVARGLAASFATPLARGQHEVVQRQLDQMAELPERYPDIVEVSVVDARGLIVAHTDPRRFNEPAEPAPIGDEVVNELVDGDRHRLEVVVPIETAVRFGTLRLILEARSRREIARETSRAVMGALAVTMCVLLVTLTLLLNALIVRPMRRVAKAVAEWKVGQPTLGVPADGPEEIRTLVTAFDGMAARLAGYTGSLAAQVEERTRELRTAYDRLTIANRQLQELAVTDGLTGVANRRAFGDRLGLEVERCRRSGQPLTLVLFDLDHFKKLNDTLGHLEGDAALVLLAGLLREGRRSADLVARYGGEEFALLLPDTPYADGLLVAERLRAATEAAVLPGRCTVSAGIATIPDQAEDARALIAAADHALYAAKAQGRNRVVGASSEKKTAEATLRPAAGEA